MSKSMHPIPETTIKTKDNFIIDPILLQKFEQISIGCLVRKLDYRILPFVLFIEIVSYINRINTGHAMLMNIEKHLNLLDYEIAWSVSLFFIAYLIFAIPSNIFMRYMGPTNYISLSILAWGVLTIGTAFVKNIQGLLVVQTFLGVTQAGFFPSMIIYFSLWYRKRDQTMRIALLVGSAIVASGFGSLFAFSFHHMKDISGLHSWQWMFLLEGLPMIPLAVITFLFLSSIPNAVRWLDNCEKQLLTNLLRDDAGIANREDVRLSWQQVFYVFIDGKIYLYALISIGNLGVIKYINSYLPIVVQDMGSLRSDTHLMAIPPYALALACCLLASYSSSRHREYGFHILFCLSVALVGFVLMIFLIHRSQVGTYIGECIACCGTFAAYPLIFSWLTNNINGHTKRSVAVGFVAGIGQFGGIIMPFVCYGQTIHERNNYFCTGGVTISLIFTAILRIYLMLENRRRDRLSKEEEAREAAIKDPCDWHPQVRYIL